MDASNRSDDKTGQIILVSLKPKSLFGRMLVIILVPLILVQVITVLVFYGRHWDNITRYMAGNLSADIATVVDQIDLERSSDNLSSAGKFAEKYFTFRTDWDENGIIPPNSRQVESTYAGRMLNESLKTKIDQPFRMDLDSHPDLITIFVQYPDGVFSVTTGRKRVFSSTSWLFILWTISTTVVMALIAILFLRGQIRPIRRLTKAAKQIGLGRPALNYRAEGAREVRQAGQAFQAMYNRIQRQISERTEMLAGVSHDLRTPLTRMKLSLAMITDDAARSELEKDIVEMEDMITGYLNYASGTISENVENADIVELIQTSIQRDLGDHGNIHFTAPESSPPIIPLRHMAIRRAISNLINNAITHAGNCYISVEHQNGMITIIIDDDGPGIPKDMRRAAVKPFSRNLNGKTSMGAGLGLSIAQEVATTHGGELLLGEAPQGGLRVRLQLPI
jgi:two-component system osmolarity sensor histidine kinase EnvZ